VELEAVIHRIRMWLWERRLLRLIDRYRKQNRRFLTAECAMSFILKQIEDHESRRPKP